MHTKYRAEGVRATQNQPCATTFTIGGLKHEAVEWMVKGKSRRCTESGFSSRLRFVKSKTEILDQLPESSGDRGLGPLMLLKVQLEGM